MPTVNNRSRLVTDPRLSIHSCSDCRLSYRRYALRQSGDTDISIQVRLLNAFPSACEPTVAPLSRRTVKKARKPTQTNSDGPFYHVDLRQACSHRYSNSCQSLTNNMWELTPIARAVRTILSDPHRAIPVETLVLTPEEPTDRLSRGDQFLEEILAKGQVLYAS